MKNKCSKPVFFKKKKTVLYKVFKNRFKTVLKQFKTVFRKFLNPIEYTSQIIQKLHKL